jgi:RNA polymerase sigma factor (sigma-70 family)
MSQRTTFTTAFDSLEAGERSVLDLIYRLGLTQAQVAEHLSLSEAAVGSTVSRAMNRLGNLMSGIGPASG